MIRGHVSASLQAAIAVEVLATRAAVQEINAVIDTGFNGALSLPPEIIQGLSLTSIGVSEGTLADGSTTEFETYLATVIWHGSKRIVVVVESPGGSLLGMSLLRDSRLSIEVRPDGEVVVQPLDSLN